MIVSNKYKLLCKIGEGNFGVVFKGIYLKTNEMVAIKSENIDTNSKLLKHEATILKYLQEHDCEDIPIVHWYGVYEKYRMLVMTFYDCSLFDYISENCISIEKKNHIIHSCVNILKSIHKQFVIHRDIKPQNFMLKNERLFIIDFGFSTFYIDSSGEHFNNNGSQDSIIGSPNYVSYFVHMGSHNSRRDDLISIGYMYFFLLNGEIFWNQSSMKDKIYFKSWEYLKNEYLSNFSFETSKRITNYLHYCYSLKFEETPEYDLLSNIFLY
jgi:casein kinase 1